MMKPKAQNEHESGMLEYLEDIIGTSRYKVRCIFIFIHFIYIKNAIKGT